MLSNDVFDNLVESLKDLGISKSNMFGMQVLKLGRKPIAGLTEDGINFKLPINSPESKLALSLQGAHLFQPEMYGKKGPLMKQWVVVPFSHSEKYPDLAEASIKFVAAEMDAK
jgi:hypothetical protein